MKGKQPGPGFELGSPSPFSTMVTIMPKAPPLFLYLIHWGIEFVKLD